MTYKEKSIVASLVSFTLILTVALVSVSLMVRNDSFTESNVFGLWVVVIVMAVILTILATVLTHIVGAIVEVVRTGSDDPRIEHLEDERDRLIDLRGTRAAYGISSIGGFLAMLSFVVGLSPLVMFTLLLLFGVTAQVLADAYRLVLYRRGF